MAAGATYEPIATTTLGSATNTVTFSSIPGTYTDLILIVNATRPAGFDDGSLRINGDTGSNYSTTLLRGNGSAASSARYSNQTLALNFLFSDTANNNIVHIFDYANTTTYKTFVTRTNDAANSLRANASLWRSTAAITSLTLINSGSSNFGADSMFTLYGITAA